MGAIGEYIFSVIGGAMVCGVLLKLAPKGQFQELMKLLCGLFLTVSLLYPLTNLDFSALVSGWTLAEIEEGEAVAAMGEDLTQDLLSMRIKQEAEEYILDKAANLEASLTAEVTLSDSDIPVPIAVTLSGEVSLATQKQLERIITEDLGISKENQLWREGNSLEN